jgi:hypothetical protein
MLAMSNQNRIKLLQFLEAQGKVSDSIFSWAKTMRAMRPLTADEQHALLDMVEVTGELALCLNRQLLQQHFGQPIAIDKILSKAESAMMRTCGLKEQMCCQ